MLASSAPSHHQLNKGPHLHAAASRAANAWSRLPALAGCSVQAAGAGQVAVRDPRTAQRTCLFSYVTSTKGSPLTRTRDSTVHSGLLFCAGTLVTRARNSPAHAAGCVAVRSAGGAHGAAAARGGGRAGGGLSAKPPLTSGPRSPRPRRELHKYPGHLFELHCAAG